MHCASSKTMHVEHCGRSEPQACVFQLQMTPHSVLPSTLARRGCVAEALLAAAWQNVAQELPCPQIDLHPNIK